MSDQLIELSHAKAPRHCAVCGGPASVLYKELEGQEHWYCARHVPPPSFLTEAQRREWMATTEIIWFFRDHRRMPSLTDPQERQILSRAISGEPGSVEFTRRYAALERSCRRVAATRGQLVAVHRAWNLGCFFAILLVVCTIVAGISAGVVWLIRYYKH